MKIYDYSFRLNHDATPIKRWNFLQLTGEIAAFSCVRGGRTMARPYLIVNRLSMIFQLNFFLQRGFAGGVEAEEDEEEDCESPEGGASVAEEGQGNAYDGA